MLGIVVGWFFSVNIQYVLALSAVALVATLAGLHPKASRSLFGVSTMAVMFLIGVFVEHCQSEKMRPQWSGEKQNYLATLLEVPALRGTNAKVLAHVTLCDTAVLRNVRHSGDVYLYFQRTVDTAHRYSVENMVERVHNNAYSCRSKAHAEKRERKNNEAFFYQRSE